jgi:hypothetical protein
LDRHNPGISWRAEAVPSIARPWVFRSRFLEGLRLAEWLWMEKRHFNGGIINNGNVMKHINGGIINNGNIMKYLWDYHGSCNLDEL